MHCGVEVTESSTNKQQHHHAPTDENLTYTITQTPSDVQSRRAPALINTCHDARFAPHVGANVDAGQCNGVGKHLSKMPREPALRNTCRCPRTSLPQRAFYPTDHVQQHILPTDNPPPSAWKSGAGEARRRVGRRRGRPPSSTGQNLRARVMQSSAPAPGAQSP